MDFNSREYVKYFRVGEMATLKIEDSSGVYLELNSIIAQVSDFSCELVIMYDQLPASSIGQEVPAILSAMVGYLHCECPVMIGRNSFEQTVFARFAGEATIRIKRNYIRQDVLIPFLYEEVRGIENARELVADRRAAPRFVNFTPQPYGESFKVAAWQGKDDLLPNRINLGGGGVRFASVDPFQRNTSLALQMFLEWPQPRVLHAVLQVTRSKPFEQTPEDRTFHNWARIRLKSRTISITAGSYGYIEDEDRQFLVDYIKEIQSRNTAISSQGETSET